MSAWIRILKPWQVSLAAALLYQGLLWMAVDAVRFPQFPHFLRLMSYSFLFVGPFAVGALINYTAPKELRRSAAYIFGYPFLFCALAFSLAFLCHLDGAICLLMAAPVFLIMSCLGSFTFWLFTHTPAVKGEGGKIMTMLLVPVLLGPIENRIGASPKHAVTESQMEIAAPIDTVWKNIIRVRKIDARELPTGIARWMGFPDPVEATLSREGVGGVRQASFKGNVLFTETIDAWEEKKRISFSIVPNTADIPPTTMDEHMIVGGQYFNVLRGTYEIRDLGNGHCLLKLTSNHVATTQVNLYADLWGRILMQDIQTRILKVIRKRCEGGAAG